MTNVIPFPDRQLQLLEQAFGADKYSEALTEQQRARIPELTIGEHLYAVRDSLLAGQEKLREADEQFKKAAAHFQKALELEGR